MRRELRKSGLRAQHLVRDIESEIAAWLHEGGVLLSPDVDNDKEVTYSSPGTTIGGSGSIHEVARSPLQLVWSITDDTFARYVVHCCARYHEVVSFSTYILLIVYIYDQQTDHFMSRLICAGKHVAGQRLTYLLRPNVTRPDHSAAALLDTPPPTDLDYYSQGDIESESDFISDREELSQYSSISEPLGRSQSALSSISETSPSVAHHDHHRYTYRAAAGEQSDDDWSVIGGDIEMDDERPRSGSGNVEQYSVQREIDVDQTPTRVSQGSTIFSGYTHPSTRQSPLSRVWERRNRANSSPSRSPARRSFRRAVMRVNPPISRVSNSFYDYLFSDRAG
jgi:hypothetical protein